MPLPRLQDRISRGLGAAARRLGAPCDAFRPNGAADPVAPENRFLRLHAAFAAESQSFKQPIGYGHSTWSGLFDSAYTQPGDYLAGPSGIYFIAAQQSLLPSLCVLTNRTVDIIRPAAPAATGVNDYGGLTAATASPILTGWPASVLFAGSGSPGDLPGDAGVPSLTVLLPATPVPLRTADLIADDMGRSLVIASAELTALGWRVLAKQATT